MFIGYDGGVRLHRPPCTHDRSQPVRAPWTANGHLPEVGEHYHIRMQRQVGARFQTGRRIGATKVQPQALRTLDDAPQKRWSTEGTSNRAGSATRKVRKRRTPHRKKPVHKRSAAARTTARAGC